MVRGGAEGGARGGPRGRLHSEWARDVVAGRHVRRMEMSPLITVTSPLSPPVDDVRVHQLHP